MTFEEAKKEIVDTLEEYGSGLNENIITKLIDEGKGCLTETQQKMLGTALKLVDAKNICKDLIDVINGLAYADLYRDESSRDDYINQATVSLVSLSSTLAGMASFPAGIVLSTAASCLGVGLTLVNYRAGVLEQAARDAFGGNANGMGDSLVESADKSYEDSKNKRVDPLIFDIGNDGFNYTSVEDGSYFDVNCDGFAEKVNWTTQDAILALDINQNGTIDDGSEVFGDRHLLRDGSLPGTEEVERTFDGESSILSSGDGAAASGITEEEYMRIQNEWVGPGEDSFWYGYEGTGEWEPEWSIQGNMMASNGFAALEQYDSNEDGIIDNNDIVYDKLIL